MQKKNRWDNKTYIWLISLGREFGVGATEVADILCCATGITRSKIGTLMKMNEQERAKKIRFIDRLCSLNYDINLIVTIIKKFISNGKIIGIFENSNLI